MGDSPPNLSQSSPGGSIAPHEPPEVRPVFVGPTTTSEFNTIRQPLDVVACWRMDDIRFEFDSSFVLPGATDELAMLSVLWKAHPGALLSLFGHADPVGDEEYNKRLSGRRATAVYALLTRDPAKWETLFNNSEDHWGVRSLQIMLDRLGHAPGRTDGTMDQGTRDAFNRFQPGGTNNSSTRRALYSAYMDAICRDINGSDFRLAAADFLGRGADPNGRADYQGCSEFNPLLMFSRAENDAYHAASDKTARNADNQPNRRVEGYLFKPGTNVSLSWWPCPAASQNTANCRPRFYSDAALRATFQANRRTHAADNDTFRCRFYDLVTDRSPCQGGGGRTLTIKIVFQLYPGMTGTDADHAIANVPYTLRVTGMPDRTGTTGSDGSVAVDFPPGSAVVLEIFGTRYVLTKRDTIEAINTMQGVQRRLVQLGYEADAIDGTLDTETDDSILRVQADNALNTDGESTFDLSSGTIGNPLQNALRGWVGE